MSLKTIIPLLEPKTWITVYTLFGQFYGSVRTSEHPETTLTLQASKGMLYIELDEIKALQIEPDREF
jgi:hypothetical protein